MSLAVARLITPMVAAYFLKAKGHAEHGEGPVMDRYMAVLRWSLDADRFRAARARIGDVPSSPFFPLAALATGGALIALAMWDTLSAGPPSFGMLLLLLVGAYLLGTVVNLAVGLVWGAIAGWQANHFTRRARFLALRLLDHRIWMMGVGVVALILTFVLGSSLPQQFFPNTDSDFSLSLIHI